MKAKKQIYKKILICSKCKRKYGTDNKEDSGLCPKCSYERRFIKERRRAKRYDKFWIYIKWNT